VVKRFLCGVPALVLTGIVFAVIHANIPSLLPLFLFACCLTLAYETSGSLWVSMTMHAAFNAVNLVIAYPNLSRHEWRKCSNSVGVIESLNLNISISPYEKEEAQNDQGRTSNLYSSDQLHG
jgi:hypothetical protein